MEVLQIIGFGRTQGTLILLEKGEEMRVKAWLLVICLILLGCYNGGCIQSKKTYQEVKLTEEDRAKIAEMTAQKIMEAEKEKESNK